MAVLLFGGKSFDVSFMNDCWLVDVSTALNETAPLYNATYQWQPCVNASVFPPSGRFGHGAVVFAGALYVFGGFVSDGLGGVRAQNDMWSLTNYGGNGAGSWAQAGASARSAK